MYFITEGETGKWKWVKFGTSFVMYLLFGVGVPCLFVIAGLTCIFAEFCGSSPFPYWFLGFGVLVFSLAGIALIAAIAVFITDSLYNGQFYRRIEKLQERL